MSVILEKTFVKNVENFVFKNEKKYSAAIAAKKNQIPPMFRKSQVLYRGMILDEELVKAIKNGYTGFKLEDISSWTTNVKMAEKFVSDKSKIVKNNPTGVGVVFKKLIPGPKIILDIQNYVMFMYFSGDLGKFDFDDSTREMAMEENEVLVDKGINLKRADILKVGK